VQFVFETVKLGSLETLSFETLLDAPSPAVFT
jgi:hypothetical protein